MVAESNQQPLERASFVVTTERGHCPVQRCSSPEACVIKFIMTIIYGHAIVKTPVSVIKL